MCFSATASFTSGTVLVLVGVQALRLTRQRIQWPYALIPVLFGLQQLLEGVLWLSFPANAVCLNTVVTQLFSYFSQVLWPIYIPLAVWLLEPAGWRRRMLALITLAGAICSLFLLSYLVRLPVTSEVRGAHIVYIFPHFHVVAATGLYLLGTCVGPLFSSHRMVQLFGMAATLSFLATYAFYAIWFISVWCFFAGALSCIVLLQFHRARALAPSSNLASAS
jgi:hypothetical protein